jgi:quinol monooxygenase YgiN
MPSANPPVTGDQVAILASGVVDESRRADLVRQLSVLRRIVADEPGTLAWEWYSDTSDASVLWVYELYADLDALDRHRQNVKSLLPGVASCFSVPITPHRCRPLAIPN